MVEKEIIKTVERFVRKVRKCNIRIERVILYGSMVSGKAHKDSDIDVAIVSPDFGKNRYREGVKLFTIAQEVDPRIEPVPLSVHAYENDTWLPLIYEIRTKGIDLKAA